jgi:hypothetical protein
MRDLLPYGNVTGRLPSLLLAPCSLLAGQARRLKHLSHGIHSSCIYAPFCPQSCHFGRALYLAHASALNCRRPLAPTQPAQSQAEVDIGTTALPRMLHVPPSARRLPGPLPSLVRMLLQRHGLDRSVDCTRKFNSRFAPADVEQQHGKGGVSPFVWGGGAAVEGRPHPSHARDLSRSLDASAACLASRAFP